MEQKNSKKTMSFTRMDRMVLESYKTLCEGLANYLGDGYEIVLHSLENYDNSVIKIINGYYTAGEKKLAEERKTAARRKAERNFRRSRDI